MALTTYTYDKSHNRTSKSVSGGASTTYVMGNGNNGAGANQIVSETTGGVTTAYGYDANGNRTSKTRVTLATTGDTTSGSTTISALAGTTGVTVGMGVIGTGIPLGTTVASVVSSTSITLSSAATATQAGTALSVGLTDFYSYDNENRLIGLEYETGGSGTGTYGYAYDYRTRRVTRVEPGPVTTHIAFNGGTSILEYGSGGASSPEVEYVRGHDYGGGVGGLEYSVRSGTPSFNFYDSRGDVTTQTDGSGAVTFQTAYEAFGTQTATAGSTPDRQKASTKEQDPTGLLNEGFLSRDPLENAELRQGANLYWYVQDNAANAVDPSGLDAYNNPAFGPGFQMEHYPGPSPSSGAKVGGAVGAVLAALQAAVDAIIDAKVGSDITAINNCASQKCKADCIKCLTDATKKLESDLSTASQEAIGICTAGAVAGLTTGPGAFGILAACLLAESNDIIKYAQSGSAAALATLTKCNSLP